MKSQDKFVSEWFGPTQSGSLSKSAVYHPRTTKVIDVARTYIPMDQRNKMRERLHQSLPPNASAPFIRMAPKTKFQCFETSWGQGWSNEMGPFIRREDPNITAAGQPSGMPVPLNAFEKFGTVIEVWGGTRGRNLGPFTMFGQGQADVMMKRFQTMKYDNRWYAGLDVPRRYSPSDYTGFPRRYICGQGFSKYGQESRKITTEDTSPQWRTVSNPL